MTDLIERLRNVAGFLESEGMVASANVVRPAADEIERLRRELAEARGALQELRIRLHAAGVAHTPSRGRPSPGGVLRNERHRHSVSSGSAERCCRSPNRMPCAVHDSPSLHLWC